MNPPVGESAIALWQRFQRLNRAGRRAQAAGAIAVFIDALSADERAAFTRWFCRWRYDARSGHQMRSHLMPLARDVVVPVLLERACRSEPESLRWLVHVRRDSAMRTDVIAPRLHGRSRMRGLLAAALARNPGATDLWRAAFDVELAAAEWGMHHLSEGVLLLPDEECQRSLDHARQVHDRAPTGALDDEDRHDHRELQAALVDYRAWKQDETGKSFSEWLRECGHQYAWPVPIYYDADTSGPST